MPVEDVFSISGRGTVVTGRVERGIVKVGEEIEIVGIKPTLKTTCTGVEMFRKLLDQGQAGDNVGVLLRGTKREEVERGQVLAKPGSIKPHTKFTRRDLRAVARTKVVVTPRSSTATVRSSTSAPPTSPAAIELPAGTEMVHAWRQRQHHGVADRTRSRWKKVCVSRSAKAAVPSVPVSWPRSKSKASITCKARKSAFA